MQGIIESIVSPFLPAQLLEGSSVGKRGKGKYLVAFIFLVLFALLLFDRSGMSYYRNSNVYFVSRMGFMLGFAGKALLIAYALSIVVSRIAKKPFSFSLAFAIVTLALSTRLYPFVFYWYSHEVYPYVYWICACWFTVVVSIGVWKNSELPFGKSFLVCLIAISLSWLMIATFIPYGMKV